MRVLLWTAGTDRADDLASRSARVADELRALGVDALVATGLAPDLSDVDLVHLLETEPPEPTFRQALRARGAGLPVVLSPSARRPSSSADADVLQRRDAAMRVITSRLASASTPHPYVDPGELSLRRVAEATLAVYNGVMDGQAQKTGESDWRGTFTPEQYIEHLESLLQLQLEAIALRDGHYAGAIEHAESLEADRERREAYIKSLETPRVRVKHGLASRLRRLRR